MPVTPGGEELVGSKPVHSGRDCTNAAKANQGETPGKNQPVFQLGRKHVAIKITSRRVAAKLAARAVYALAVKRWLARAAEIKVVRQDLLVTEAEVFVECEFIRLKGIFAAESDREEIACKVDHTPLGSRGFVGSMRASEQMRLRLDIATYSTSASSDFSTWS